MKPLFRIFTVILGYEHGYRASLPMSHEEAWDLFWTANRCGLTSWVERK